MGQLLNDPILRDLVRLVGRHPDITGDYKTRLQLGLAQLDQELTDWRELTLRPASETEAPKRGKR